MSTIYTESFASSRFLAYFIFLIIFIIFYLLNNLLKINYGVFRKIQPPVENFNTNINYGQYNHASLNNSQDNFYTEYLDLNKQELQKIIPSKLIKKINLNNKVIIGTGTNYVTELFAKLKKIYINKTGITINYISDSSIKGIGVFRKLHQPAASPAAPHPGYSISKDQRDGDIQALLGAAEYDFSVINIPLKNITLENKLVQFPIIIEGIVPIINIPGIKQGTLKLDGKTLGDIFLGVITKWNDVKIINLNPEFKNILNNLQKLDITICYREDTSGITYFFTDYLSRNNSSWKNIFGTNSIFHWKFQHLQLHGINDAEISRLISNNVGSIGYIDYNYVVKNKLNYVLMKNDLNSKFIIPSQTSISDYMKNSLNRIKGEKSWPIVRIIYGVMYKKPKNVIKSNETLDFFNWFYHQKEKLNYIPIPNNYINYIINNIWNEIDKIGYTNVNF